MIPSRASSIADVASSHLVTSKHDAKCRRVPRIISRRLYCYRRKSATIRPKQNFSYWNRWPSDRDFSPEFSDRPQLEETLLRFLVKYPRRGSYSADSDPLVLFRSEMNKSTFFNHSLMKRRYSVPETVMRKHKLQAAESQKRSLDQQSSELNLKTRLKYKDESCQTDESDTFHSYGYKQNYSLYKKNNKGKRRESVRCFRKANSYCQYKSLSMFHKRMLARNRDAHSLSSLENLQNDVIFSVDKSHQTDNPETDASVKTESFPSSENNITGEPSDSIQQSTNLLSYISSTNFCGNNPVNKKCYNDTLNAKSELLPSRCLGKELFDTSSPRKVLVNSKSLDQNTSGYNTVSNSLNDTPRKKTPESSKTSNEIGGEDLKKNKYSTDLFPVTFQSESIFVHPYQKGFLSHKELHHISIRMVPDTKMENNNDYYKTEIKVNVNDQTKDTKTHGSSTKKKKIPERINESINQEEQSTLNNIYSRKFRNEKDTTEYVVATIKQDKEEFLKTNETEYVQKSEVIINYTSEKSNTDHILKQTNSHKSEQEQQILKVTYTKDDLTMSEQTNEKLSKEKVEKSEPNKQINTKEHQKSHAVDYGKAVLVSEQNITDVTQSETKTAVKAGSDVIDENKDILSGQDETTNDTLWLLLNNTVECNDAKKEKTDRSLELMNYQTVTAKDSDCVGIVRESEKHFVVHKSQTDFITSMEVEDNDFKQGNIQFSPENLTKKDVELLVININNNTPQERESAVDVSRIFVTKSKTNDINTQHGYNTEPRTENIRQDELKCTQDRTQCCDSNTSNTLTANGPTDLNTVRLTQILPVETIECNIVEPLPSKPNSITQNSFSDINKLNSQKSEYLMNSCEMSIPSCADHMNHKKNSKQNTSLTHFNSINRQNSDDCSVPTNFNPVKLNEQSKLKIEIDVGNVDLSTNIHDMLLGCKTEYKVSNNHPLPNKSKEPDKYNTKTALNYLFQKLGDSYPKKHFLKQPVFHNSSQYGRYYSDLPKISGHEYPPKVLYNNQTYDILSGNLLPNEMTILKHMPVISNLNDIQNLSEGNNEHSDSDVSIPDSLEDFQQVKSKPNKYQKYDQKLTRGEITEIKQPTKGSKKEGISYFLPLVDDHALNTADMPIELKEKLCKRSKSISKHSSCIETPRKSSKSNGKLIHKQIQTCLNVEESLKKRRKQGATDILNGSDNLNSKNESASEDLDKRITNILMAGLKLQDVEQNQHKNNSVWSGRSTSDQSIQTDIPDIQPIISEYVEMYNMQSTTANEFKSIGESEFHNMVHEPENKLFEMVHSEEETGRVNSTNYYRTFKKSKRIYYPTKDRQVPENNGEARSRSTQNYSPIFTKYQRRLKEFKQQTCRQTHNSLSPCEISNGKSTDVRSTVTKDTLLPLSYPKFKKTLKEKTFKVKNHVLKVPGPRSHRFYQRFEAIPEEHSNSSSEQNDINANSTESSTPLQIKSTLSPTCEEKCNEKVDNKVIREEEIKIYENENPDSKLEDLNEKGANHNEYRDKPKSQKGRDSLFGVNEHEELITLSRGWINFYLLKGNSIEENGVTEEHEDENVTLSETFCIPQQYTVHVHATPEGLTTPKAKSTLPGLCKSSPQKRDCKNDNTQQVHKTSLPEIGNMPNSNHCQLSSCSNSKMNQRQNSLPKLQLSGDESDSGNMRRQDDGGSRTESNAEPVKKDSARAGTPSSTTCSNRSKSPADITLSQNKTKKVQRYHRPHTFHSARNRNQWSLTVEGSHNTNEKRLISDIEMQLLLKNNLEGVTSNHSWKLTVKGEAENTDNSSMGHGNHRSCLPNLNVNYNLLPYVCRDGNSMSCSSNYSRSNSVSSYCEEKYLNKDDASYTMKRFNKDLKLQIVTSDDELTVKGLAITPERKPRVRTMSERDLTRLKLIKSNSDSKL